MLNDDSKSFPDLNSLRLSQDFESLAGIKKAGRHGSRPQAGQTVLGSSSRGSRVED